MALLDLEEIGEHLSEPPEGKQQLKGHDKGYGKVKETFDSVRDTCNDGIDKINGLLESAGRGERLTRLPEKSLDEYVVFPLSGNYYRIQQNASACHIFKAGTTAWSNNFVKVAGGATLAFEGQSQVAFSGHVTGYALVAKAVGSVVSAGARVYDSIALVSEEIAIRVESVLMELGERLARLVKTLVKRFAGAIGWAMLAVDLAKHGLSVITDVVDDVKGCIEAIETCFSLKDKVEKWASTQAERLAAFKEILGMVKDLPSVDLGTPLGEVKDLDLNAIRDAIKATDPDFSESEEGQEATDDLTEAGDDIAAESGYVHPSWAEHCATPPPGMAHLPYDPDDPLMNGPRNPITGAPINPDVPMKPPTPGVSTKRYYDMYEEWRSSLRPPRWAPEATGKPRGH